MSCEASDAGGLPGGDRSLSAGGGLALGRLAATAAALARAPPRRLAARLPDAAAAEAPAPSPTRFLHQEQDFARVAGSFRRGWVLDWGLQAALAALHS